MAILPLMERLFIGSAVAVQLLLGQLIYLLRQYFEPIAPSNLTNVRWKRIAEIILSGR